MIEEDICKYVMYENCCDMEQILLHIAEIKLKIWSSKQAKQKENKRAACRR